MRFSDLAGRSVALLGLGLETRCFAERWLERLPASKLTVLTNHHQEPTDECDPLAAKGVVVEPGIVSADRLSAFEVVVKSPGFSPYDNPVASAIERGVLFTSASAVWFSENPGKRTVCITGTKGKSTTASLLAHVLTALGRANHLAGNIGVPLLALDDDQPDALWILELSSYQATDFGGRPSIGVVLNLFPEHLDWHGSEDRYYADKLEVLRRIEQGTGIVNGSDRTLMERCPPLENRLLFNSPGGISCKGHHILVQGRPILSLEDCHLRGRHNGSNIAAVLTICQLLGLELDPCAQAVATFKGLAHRQQILGQRDGLWWVDDSLSTTPHATLAAIETFDDRPCTVLVGGHDRGLSWSEFVERLPDLPQLAAIVTMPDNGPQIADDLEAAASPPPIHRASDLAEAVEMARALSQPGGVVLLSPGAPSYGHFPSFKERGEAFAHHAGFRRQGFAQE